jgi:hypothetical protein
MKDKCIELKLGPGVCCPEPSCTTRTKDDVCNSCGTSCKGCRWAK